MVSFTFKAEFIPLIHSGDKFQTIRRSMRCKPGETMHLFTGLRTKDCQRIGEAICQEVFPVMFRENSFHTGFNHKVSQMDNPDELLAFAKADGFSSWEDCHQFFRNHYEFPFTGFVHRWDPSTFKKAEASG